MSSTEAVSAANGWELRRRFTRMARERTHVVELLENVETRRWRRRALCGRVSQFDCVFFSEPDDWRGWNIRHEVTCVECRTRVATLQGRGEWIANEHELSLEAVEENTGCPFIVLVCTCDWQVQLPYGVTPAKAWEAEQRHRRDVAAKTRLTILTGELVTR